MLEYLTLILMCQLVGVFAITGSNLPVPGPVAGMIFLFLFLLIRGHVPDELASVANTLLNNLSLLFVPAGVGVMALLTPCRTGFGPTRKHSLLFHGP
ncbi:CidA/LrgA family protein [Granulosicoccus sp.]|nr:CidA/LrgA family protein [Granulosicoccus sp.]